MTDIMIALEESNGPMLMHGLMFKSMMNNETLMKYLDTLIANDLVEMGIIHKHKMVVMTTKGHRFLRLIKEMNTLHPGMNMSEIG